MHSLLHALTSCAPTTRAPLRSLPLLLHAFTAARAYYLRAYHTGSPTLVSVRVHGVGAVASMQRDFEKRKKEANRSHGTGLVARVSRHPLHAKQILQEAKDTRQSFVRDSFAAGHGSFLRGSFGGSFLRASFGDLLGAGLPAHRETSPSVAALRPTLAPGAHALANSPVHSRMRQHAGRGSAQPDADPRCRARGCVRWLCARASACGPDTCESTDDGPFACRASKRTRMDPHGRARPPPAPLVPPPPSHPSRR